MLSQRFYSCLLLSLTLCAVPLGGCAWNNSSRKTGPHNGYGPSRNGVADSTRRYPVRQVALDDEIYPDDGGSHEENPLTLTDFSPDNISKTMLRLSGYGPDKQIAAKAFAKGEALFQEAVQGDQKKRAARLEAAAKLYQQAAGRWPDSPMEERALMMVGECYYFADRYPDAMLAYDYAIKRYRNTEYIDTIAKRRFALAHWWLEKYRENPHWPTTPNLTDTTQPWFDTFGAALKLFDQIRLDDPTNDLADDATMAAAGAYYEAGKIVQAEQFYADLRRSFPNSKHQFKAHLMGMICNLQLYQGPDYDGAPLQKSEQLIRTMCRQFPKQAREQRKYLEKAFKEVRAKQAERKWQMAQYFESQGKYGGAAFYYKLLIRDYPQASVADEARKRLEAIAGRPDIPPQKLKWLVDAFPERKEKSKPLVTRELLEKISEKLDFLP